MQTVEKVLIGGKLVASSFCLLTIQYQRLQLIKSWRAIILAFEGTGSALQNTAEVVLTRTDNAFNNQNRISMANHPTINSRGQAKTLAASERPRGL